MTQENVSDTGYTPDETAQTVLQSELLKTIAEARSQSADVTGLIKALSKAQGEFPDIERDRTVQVRTRSGDSYAFKYATLAKIISSIRSALSNNGIAYTQIITYNRADNGYYLTTSIHWENQFISSVVPLLLVSMDNQQFGSALTYMKRYCLAALVGVAPDEDDDGNLADGNEVKAMQESVNRGTVPQKPAPDALRGSGVETGVEAGQAHSAPGFTFVEAIKNDDGTYDWLAWGRKFIAEVQAMPTSKLIDTLIEVNAGPYNAMEKQAPKMFANLCMSIIKARKALEKVNAE